MNTYRIFAALSLTALSCAFALGDVVTPVHVYESNGYAGTDGGFVFATYVNQDISGAHSFDDTVTAPAYNSESAWLRRQGAISSTKAWLKATTSTTYRSSCSTGNYYDFISAYGHLKLDYITAIQSHVWWDNVIVKVSDLTTGTILFDKETVAETGSINLTCTPGDKVELYVGINQNNIAFGTPTGDTSFRAEGTLTPYSVSSGLYVKSLNPASGVTISASNPDLNGKSSGPTTLGLIYDTGSSTTLTAPAAAGVNAFNHWQLDGVDQTKGVMTLNVALTVPHGSRTATAIYDPAPAAVRCSPSSTVGGSIVNGILALSGFPTTGGMTVNVMSDTESVAKPQVSSVSIPSSSNQGFFKVTTYPVNASTNVTISAYTSLKSVSTTLTVTPPTVLKVAVIPGAINGGNNTTMYVYLNGKPASSGVTANVGSASATLAKPIVSSVFFAQGVTVKAVAVTSAGVDAATPVTLNASMVGGPQVTTTLTLKPATVARVYFPNNSSQFGGWPVNGLVYLNGKAGPSGLTVNLSSENTAVATVPATVQANAQVSAVAFTTTTTGVDTNTDVEINAWTDPSVVISTMLTVKQPTLQKINMFEYTFWQNADGLVFINGRAGPSGLHVNVFTDNPAVLTLTSGNLGIISPGYYTLGFSGHPATVTKNTVVKITAQLDNGSTMSVSVTITPPTATER